MRGERAYKYSKYFWFDSGIACFLSGIHAMKELDRPAVKGRYFENFVLQQILSWASLQMIAPEIFYWRPKSQTVEVDFIIRHGKRVIAVEVKSSEELTFADSRSLREFLNTHPEADRGILVYTGQKTYPLASNIYAVPYPAL